MFSPQEFCTAIDSNIVDMKFFVPGTNQPGAMRFALTSHGLVLKYDVPTDTRALLS